MFKEPKSCLQGGHGFRHLSEIEQWDNRVNQTSENQRVLKCFIHTHVLDIGTNIAVLKLWPKATVAIV